MVCSFPPIRQHLTIICGEAWKTILQALRLCTGLTAHRGSRGIALTFHDHGTRGLCGVSVTPRPLFTPGKDSVPIVQEAGWALGPVWTGAENLAPTGIRSPDRPARSQSLYQLRYPAHFIITIPEVQFQTLPVIFIFACPSWLSVGSSKPYCQ